MDARRVLCAVAGAGMLAGCAAAQDIPVVGGLFGGGAAGTAQAQPAQAAAMGPFERQLQAEYLQLARFERDTMADFASADTFAAKAAAVGSRPVQPEQPQDWNIQDQATAAEISTARQELVSILDGGARERAPYQAAVAQARFDCWVEQAEEGWQTNDIRACRAMYRQALADLRGAMAPAPQPVAAPLGEPQFLVFFDFDRSTLTPTAQQTIDEVARSVREGRVQQVQVVGHADTVGPDAYNQRLSEARAEAVRQRLVQAGVDAQRISTAGRGQSDLLVETPDNVREPSNRRAEILFR